MLRRPAPPLLLPIAVLAALACASEPVSDASRRERIERATETVGDDPTVQARVEGVRAAEAREAQPQLIDEIEMRVGDDYFDDDHQVRVIARLPLNRPSETSAEREVLRAETDIALSRLEETSLERRAERCFPAIEALATKARREVFADYAEWQQALLAWNADWRGSGMINELAAARFELESRIKLAAWESAPVESEGDAAFALPEIGSRGGVLVRSAELVRETVRNHHPSVALRRATADRYRALAQRARARNQPWIKFVDVRYEYRTDDDESGVGGQLAFEIPLGGQTANAGRYEALLRESAGEQQGLVEDQVARSLQALSELQEFEARTGDWRTLERLAREAEAMAERWWRERLAKPSEVAALLDEAFAAKSAVLEARERAGSSRCTLLAMTGVSADDWPRAPAPTD